MTICTLLRLYNISPHLDQNWLINECARRKKAKILESRSLLSDIEEITLICILTIIDKMRYLNMQ